MVYVLGDQEFKSFSFKRCGVKIDRKKKLQYEYWSLDAQKGSLQLPAHIVTYCVLIGR